MNKTRITDIVLVLAVLALVFMVEALRTAHYERVIRDQRAYIEAGCRGRYQGE